ncbi:alkaline phosphatase [Rhodovulum euryhalinum]|uniref:Alkaline phosphatase n=1 Tax=Rhodovulum euryhalinum TaxID=35805 RepID=A0A4R2KU75_9RHOB|nr:alkaline phosphatase [Rhodovulum euryhalinum]TCO70265.1 alkaline phosphatase [Rhodovulum euryhalinum]
MSFRISRRALLAASVSIAIAAPLTAPAATLGGAQNVILFISDGASWGTWDMASYWATGQKNGQSYADFDIKLGMTTTPLNTSTTPKNTGVPEVFYDPAKAWDATASTGNYGGRPSHFEGYDYIKRDYTDSAAAGTALATGEKTYNSAIDYDDFGAPLAYVSEQLKEELGKAVGVVSSVPYSHATPATFAAQNINRNNYGEIASFMVNEGVVDLVMGGGHPLYDSNGELRATPRFANETGGGGGYTPESVWTALNDGTAGMTLIETRAEFEALADGTLTVDGRLFGLAQTGDTLQQGRTLGVQGADAATPSGVAYNPDVPTLETMTKGALNHLGKDDDGFFVMIEGGAVDWAAHANQTDRIIEEQVDFDNSVSAAIDWVNANSSWDETLMVILTDHGNAMPMGPNSDTIAFEPIQNNGQGVLPGVMWHYGTHTNENTRMWAHGAGADLFLSEIVGQDPGLVQFTGHNADGSYIENTAVYRVIAQATGLNDVAPVPLPAGVWLFGTGLALLAGFGRKARKA